MRGTRVLDESPGVGRTCVAGGTNDQFESREPKKVVGVLSWLRSGPNLARQAALWRESRGSHGAPSHARCC